MKNIYISTIFILLGILQAQSQVQMGDIITGGGVYDGLEKCVAISDNGSRIILGAAFTEVNGNQQVGAALVYELVNNDWQQLGSDLEGSNELERFGQSVEMAANGNRIAIGSGEKVQVYDLVSGDWQQKGSDITIAGISSIGALQFSFDGNILLVGFAGFSAEDSLRVYMFENNDWQQMGDGFDDINFGHAAISNSGERVVMQKLLGNGNYDLRTYDFVGGNWMESASAIDSAPLDIITDGFSLNGSGNRLLVTVNHDNAETGVVRTYDYMNNDWTQVVPELPIVIDNSFGAALRVSYNGSIFILGTSDDNPIGGVSDIFLYQLINGQWQLVSDDINGSSDDEQANGHVDITGDGSRMVYAGNITPGGQTVQFVAGFDYSGVLSVGDNIFLEDIQLYPNPTSGETFINLNKTYDQIEVDVVNILGQAISSNIFKNENGLSLQINGAQGVYFAQIRTSNNLNRTIKIIKN